MNEYKVLQVIGKGAHAVVTKAQHHKTGKIVALKTCPKQRGDEEGMPQIGLREFMTLQAAQHANVIRMLDCYNGCSTYTFVLEYMPHNLFSLLHHHDGSPRWPVVRIRSYMKQLLEGLWHLHGWNILHRDLKPANMLLDEKQATIKICDFGLARKYSRPARAYTPEVVTLDYRAPELLLGLRHYSTPIDIWSLGCVFVELINGGHAAFPGDCQFDQMMRIFRVLGTPTDEVWSQVSSLPHFKLTFPKWTAPASVAQSLLAEELKTRHSSNDLVIPKSCLDLIDKMLVLDPNKRITAREALKHEFFADESNDDAPVVLLSLRSCCAE